MSSKALIGMRAKLGVVVLGIGSLLVAPAFAGATAVPVAETVREISVESSAGVNANSVLTLTFDKPVAKAEAERYRQELAAQSVVQTEDVDYISCEGDLTRSDANGTWTVQYVCFSGYGTIPWGFRLSQAVRNIVVGLVTEDGLRWWRNGASQPKNAGHVVPADYHFHGTMNPVYHYNTVSYQDYMTFRHNVGPGGTGSVTFAGSVETLP
ncbi:MULTISPECIES: hypothetical protein [Saccharothrix]|uniref:hypothetical protein n=1 Tax=Saccharothrix TaxID=2071 RepID=UPI000939A0FF|nr:hypothetical protein [Saccharothrix sp. CB00851]OKI39331.1 hypothetical protein A6A25_04060 [Saccharothrix sp. CB00851]